MPAKLDAGIMAAGVLLRELPILSVIVAY
jgi:hypothetical protein